MTALTGARQSAIVIPGAILKDTSANLWAFIRPALAEAVVAALANAGDRPQ